MCVSVWLCMGMNIMFAWCSGGQGTSWKWSYRQLCTCLPMGSRKGTPALYKSSSALSHCIISPTPGMES